MRRRSLPPLLVASLVIGCGPTSPKASAPTPVPTKEISLNEAGVGAAWMDRSVDACQDFYEFACGNLIKMTEIPPDKSAWGPGYELVDLTEGLLRRTLEEAARAASDDPTQKKLGAWYGACMNEGAIEEAGTKPLADLMSSIAAVKDAKSLYAAVIELHKRGIFPLFEITSQQDFSDATLMIVGIDQSGLGLPDRDYYLEDDAKTKEIREFYRGHVERLLKLGGDADEAAKKAADEVVRVETALAKLAQDKVARRDPRTIYNKIDRAGLEGAAKRFPWGDYFKGLGFPAIKDVSVNSVAYLQGVDELMATEPPQAFRSYLRAVLLRSQAERLSKAFVDEGFTLHQRLLGQKELEPRWKRCVRSADRALGELLAQEYVKLRFDAESRQAAADLMKGIRRAMKTELAGLAWMDPATRAAAEEKLEKMNDKIGYPAAWRSYDFDVAPAQYAKNSLAADAFELARLLGKVGKPVDRAEWGMTPPTVNAYYDASLNEMVFPAGILQPPYFSRSFAAAVNYGATGATMGHELTHGFDDEGSQFDGFGNLRNWWSRATGERFKEQTRCVIDQYSEYEAVPGVKLSGELTAGENIADIGGTKLAYSAFMAARKGASPRLVAEGYTEPQLFFIAYGQSWCETMRPELLELLAKTNPHSPARFRVNGVVVNLPAFAEAFQCKEGTPMRPAKACSVW